MHLRSRSEGHKFNTDQIGAVICARNAEAIIRETVTSAFSSGINSVLVVDGNSSDRTREIAASSGARVMLDDGVGLGAARNLGAKNVSLPLTLFIGPGDLMSREAGEAMVDVVNKRNALAVGCRIASCGQNYLSQAYTSLRSAITVPGPARTLGTPTLFVSQYLLEQPYDTSRQFSDDSELFERWEKTFGPRFWVADVSILEAGGETTSSISKRWKYYGISDFEVYSAGVESGWPLRRRFSSMTHPFRRQIAQPFKILGMGRWLQTLPFLVFVTGVRYFSWIKEYLRSLLVRHDF